MSRYFLSKHTYACEISGYAVFLDLKHDHYMAVAGTDVDVLRGSVEGWPMGSRGRDGIDHARNASKQEVVRALVAEGLLTTNLKAGKLATAARMPAATRSFWDRERVWPELDRRCLVAFSSAWLRTSASIHTLPIGMIVGRVRRRKDREALQAPLFDIAQARRLTAVHLALQPLFFDATNACLRNSLTLIEFLSRYAIYPSWVFGVRMSPFSAHAWVQYGPIVFTDPVEHIRSYTPLMVI